MNSLSLTIYLSQVLPSIATALAIGSAMVLILSLCSSAAFFFSSCDEFRGEEEIDKYRTISRGLVLKAALPAAVVLLFSLLLPTKNTILLIAGSEFGQEALNSEVGQQLVGDIQEILKNQLNELK